MGDYYTWAEFVAEVKKLLPIEAQRVGVGTTATDYLTSLIRQAVIDLQRVVPGFQINHETLYHPEDLVAEGHAMRGVKPPQSAFRSLSLTNIYTDDEDVQQILRWPGIPHPWGGRFDLVNGLVPVNDGNCRYSIDNAGYTFYVYPVPTTDGECWLVSMFWDGQKLDFQDDEQVPFSEAAALAVSYFVKGNTAPEVEDSIQNGAYWMDRYEKQKPKLYLDDKAKRGVN